MPRFSTYILLAFLFSFALHAQITRQEETRDYYRKWVDQDVLYIISPEEKAVFSRLSTDEERDLFIEQFWKRREASPEGVRGEFKEEHYRRLQYANDHFSSGIPGWKTDRGMIYIKLGEPDQIVRNPTGGHYNRPSWEGGGSTSTFPFEVWRYRQVDGIGQDVEIEFVDTTLTGSYELSIDPNEKDALLRAAGAGATIAELRGLSSRVDRIVQRTSPTPGHNPLAVGYGRLKDQPFERLNLLQRVQRPPQYPEKSLETFITSRIRYDTFPLQVQAFVIPVSDTLGEVRISMATANRNLQFQDKGGYYEAAVEVMGRVTTLNREIAASFTELVQARRQDIRQNQDKSAMFQKKLQLKPGRYKLELVVYDHHSEQVGTAETSLVIPGLEEDELQIAPLILASGIQFVTPELQNQSDDPFNLGPVRLFPNLSGTYQREEIPLYFKVYNALIDQSSQAGLVRVSYRVRQAGNTLFDESEKVTPKPLQDHSFAMVKVLPGDFFPVGEYELEIVVEDLIANRTVQKSVPFRVSSQHP